MHDDHDDHAAACHAGQSPAKASRLSCVCTVCLFALIRILLVSHLSCFWSLAASARTLADALRVLLRMSDASSGRCVWLAERVNGSNHRARMNKLGVATFRQNLSLHPEDWHCACFRPVFWLAFFLHQRLPMRLSAHSGFLSVSSGLQQRGAAPACLPVPSNRLGIDTGFPFHLPLEQGEAPESVAIICFICRFHNANSCINAQNPDWVGVALPLGGTVAGLLWNR